MRPVGRLHGPVAVALVRAGARFDEIVDDQAHRGAVFLDAAAPEALIYEPQPRGALRLVGVEYIVIASTWAGLYPNAGPPALEGDLLNFIDAPNRYGLPAFYEMHVWAWEANPKGSFADWNTHVTCAMQPAE